ncbi:alkaline phosphatase family protein [Longimicrobium sp.]|uniref:alkaline phosphatase family protein n=1 Tax=Longimicrobium sp. TaxID=2029185 RepID=UPI002CD2A040|nr:alkaline phosphatase family protein [Longimicrobium sp.]HSU14318.1 alkaline phosphatase family protein [Longimicrobium sp.]
MSKRGWVIAALAVLAAAAGYVALKLGRSTGEVADLVAEGAEKVLREPMRPARGSPRVLVFALDGVGADQLEAVIRSGRARSIARLVGRPRRGEPGVYQHAYAVPGVLSILPSTTYAAWTSLFTGQPAGRTGVPGNEWFAREEDRFYAPAPVTVSENTQALQVYSDQLMGRVAHAPTLYEQAGVRAYVSLAALQRGADLVTVPDPVALGPMVSAFAEGAQEGEVKREVYAQLDEGAAGSLLSTIEKRGVADLQVVYFPGVDLWTHVAPDPLRAQQAYVETVVDRVVGRVLDAYRRRHALRDTWVVFVADHGHTPVLNDDLHSLGTAGDDEPPAVLHQAGFRVRPFHLDVKDDERVYQSVVAYQGAMAYVYLADRSACPNPADRCDWRRPPRFEQDVLPVVRAFDAANRTGAGVPQLRGTLDLIFARQPRPFGQDAAPFQVWDGEKLVAIGEYLRAHPRPDLLDLERRMDGLATGPYGNHAGDVLLLARTGMQRPIGERFYFSGIYHSWHGSPTAQDSRIPLVVALPGGDGRQLRARVRAAAGEHPTQLDVTRLVLSLLGRG